MDMQLLKFIPTPHEKNVGIAVVRFERRFIFRFKVSAKQEGGYWVQAPALKTGTQDGKDRYEGAFQFDSSYEAEEIKNFVLEEVLKVMNPSLSNQAQAPSAPSALSTPSPVPAWQQISQDLPF